VAILMAPPLQGIALSFQYNVQVVVSIGGGAGGAGRGHRPPIRRLGHHAIWAPTLDSSGS